MCVRSPTTPCAPSSAPPCATIARSSSSSSPVPRWPTPGSARANTPATCWPRRSRRDTRSGLHPGRSLQISAKKWQSRDRTRARRAARLTSRSDRRRLLNIDIDASTLVDLELPTLAEQQQLNAHLTADFTEFIRGIEPAGVTVSIGGEIGEVGLQNSTVAGLVAFMNAYLPRCRTGSECSARIWPASRKISVQTGTSHGGVFAGRHHADVAVDFETLGSSRRRRATTTASAARSSMAHRRSPRSPSGVRRG